MSACCWRSRLAFPPWSRLWWVVYRSLWWIAILLDDIRLKEHRKAIAEWETRHGKSIQATGFHGPRDVRYSRLWLFSIRWFEFWYGLSNVLVRLRTCTCVEEEEED